LQLDQRSTVVGPCSSPAYSPRHAALSRASVTDNVCFGSRIMLSVTHAMPALPQGGRRGRAGRACFVLWPRHSPHEQSSLGFQLQQERAFRIVLDQRYQFGGRGHIGVHMDVERARITVEAVRQAPPWHPGMRCDSVFLRLGTQNRRCDSVMAPEARPQSTATPGAAWMSVDRHLDPDQ